MRYLDIFPILFFTLCTQIELHQTKHYRTSSCASLEPCPAHKSNHKICGSDGKLYPSQCHLRKASCERNTSIRPAHPDICFQDDDGDDELGQFNKIDLSSQSEQEDISLEYSTEDQCEPKEYDLMKETVLAKVKNVSSLFNRLDDNNDGMITLNELWKHSSIFKSPDSACLLTDLMTHEDSNDDNKLDNSEFQTAFNKLYSVVMVTLDETLAVNRIDAHSGDNVEIRCDISGEPQKPAIKWYRHGVNLSSLNLPFIKVFSDGSLYLTDLQLSFAGNYTCQATNNPIVKQTHIVHVIVNPVVEVSPSFQWAPIGGIANFECRYETFENDFDVRWFKNDEELVDGARLTLLNNNTQIQISSLEQTDTGAYSCRVKHKNGAIGQSMASLLVQEDTVQSKSIQTKPQKLWIFHSSGLTILKGVCGQTLHEIDALDIIYQNSIQLCGNNIDSSQQVSPCEWSQDLVVLNKNLYIGQPNLNRLIVFDIEQLNVIQVIVTDPQPRRLWAVEEGKDNQIWVLCDGNANYFDERTLKESNQDENESDWKESLWSADASTEISKLDFLNDKYTKNRKTIQVVRLPNRQISKEVKHRVRRQADVVHLQPVDGHFDLVYDLFLPDRYDSIFKSEAIEKINNLMKDLTYAYATHWEERSLVKISIKKMEYMHSIRLTDCQPMTATIINRRAGGLVAVLCQTPITHRLNGQLILDQVTDAILAHNTHINAHQSYLSPDQRYLVSIMHEHNNSIPCIGKCGRLGYNTQFSSPINSSTIIVQRISENGVEFLYDVRTSLDVVNCMFVWRNGKYDFVMASGTPNREDLLYLFLQDGHVELISGVGRPTESYRRSLALSNKNRVISVTATESVFTVDMSTNKILCESNKHFEKPQSLIWTN